MVPVGPADTFYWLELITGVLWLVTYSQCSQDHLVPDLTVTTAAVLPTAPPGLPTPYWTAWPSCNLLPRMRNDQTPIGPEIFIIRDQ